MGAAGVSRLDASANHSSEKERTLPPRAAETRSIQVYQHKIFQELEDHVGKLKRGIQNSSFNSCLTRNVDYCETSSSPHIDRGRAESGINLVGSNSCSCYLLGLVSVVERHDFEIILEVRSGRK